MQNSPVFKMESVWMSSVYPFSKARLEFGDAVFGDAIYVVGGIDDEMRVLDTIDCYYPLSGEVVNLAKLPSAIHHPAVAIVGNTIYIAGGFKISGDPSDKDFKRHLTESSDFWSFTVPGGPLVAKSPLPEAKAAFSLVHHDGFLYAIGGQNGKFGNCKTVHKYDLVNNAWYEVSELVYPRNHLTAFSNGSHIYAVGGRYYENIDAPRIRDIVVRNYNTVEVYEASLNSWRLLDARMPEGKSGHAGVIVDNRFIIIYGGEVFAESLSGTYIFDTDSYTWVTGPTLNVARHGFGHGVVVDGKIYAVGGSSRYAFGPTKTAEVLRLL